MPKYGDKTAKRLDAYLKGYTIPKGRVRTGLIAPFYDMQRNFNTMNQLQLKESNPFFIAKQIMKLPHEDFMEHPLQQL